jgi:hypothetical protein
MRWEDIKLLLEVMAMVIPFLALLVGGLIWLDRIKRRRTAALNAAWKTLGDQLALSFTPAVHTMYRQTHPRIDGSYRGRTVSLYQYFVPFDKNEIVHTKITCQLQVNGNPRLRIMAKGLLSKLASLAAADEYILGEADFDRSFVVRATASNFAAAVLASQAVRRSLIDAGAKLEADITMESPQVSWESFGQAAPAAYAAALNALCDLADAAERAPAG